MSTGKRMNRSKQKKLLLDTYERLFKVFGQQHCTLDYSTPHELMIATIMSAQCTDVRVNLVTKELFKKYPDLKAFAEADQAELEKDIRSVGFYRNKATNIIKACQGIVERFDSQVPDNMDDLTSLAGIGRKTANVILGDAFEVPGFPVDTHVKRVLNRIGAVSDDDPVKIEAIVNKLVPDELWVNFSHIIILHGRSVCDARKPQCEQCVLNDLCAFYKEGKK